jgi:hypothetical protein
LKIVTAPLIDDRTQAILLASTFASKLFRSGVPGGTTALCNSDILTLIENIPIDQNEIFWEIGCGTPNLAFSLSAASFGGMVICTDLRKSFIYIKFYIVNFSQQLMCTTTWS